MTLVIGIGNLLLKDEGIGVHVVQALKKMDLSDYVNLSIIDGGTSPDILLLLERAHKLIIIDATKGGDEPGAIYRFCPEDIALEPDQLTSIHQIGLLQSLKMMQLMGTEPEEITIIGIEPKEMDFGLELSPELQERIPQMTELVLEEIGVSTDRQGKGD